MELPAARSEVLTVALAVSRAVGRPEGDVQETHISVWREGRDGNLDLRADSRHQGVREILERASA